MISDIIEYNLSQDIEVNILRKYRILPIKQNNLHILIGTSNIDQDTKDIKHLFNSPIKFIKIDDIFLEYEYRYLSYKIALYNLAINSIKKNIQEKENLYILEFLDIVFEFCIKQNISDIHFESLKNHIVIRFRLDGVLIEFFKFNKKLYSLISAVVKFLANLDISQKRLPLNGAFSKDILKYSYDFRVSTMPTIYGESIVLRILDNKNIQKSLSSIGFLQNELDIIYKNIQLSQGLILVTGPTGSGKTTTLYSILNYLNQKSKKIITIEDPVEYKIDGIMQINLNPQIELDYHTVLKNILRQDPDILLIGEIRDTLSAKIAIRAALTGHLVIATLHTNDSIETITRLIDLQIEPYLISTTLKMVIAQRLVRKLCSCKIYDEVLNSYKAIGCEKCNLTGYKDRTIIAEVLEVSRDVAESIYQNKPIKIKEFNTLKYSAKKLLKNGTISYEEFVSKVNEI